MKLVPIHGQAREAVKGDHMYGDPCWQGCCRLCNEGSTPVITAVVPIKFLEDHSDE